MEYEPFGDEVERNAKLHIPSLRCGAPGSPSADPADHGLIPSRLPFHISGHTDAYTGATHTDATLPPSDPAAGLNWRRNNLIVLRQ